MNINRLRYLKGDHVLGLRPNETVHGFNILHDEDFELPINDIKDEGGLGLTYAWSSRKVNVT